MNNLRLKEAILNKCKELLQLSIDNIQSAVDDAQKGANEYGQPKDRYDSYKAQLYRKRDMFAQQLQKAIDQMAVLDKINTDLIKTTIGFGSVVHTDKQNLVIAVGLGKLEVEGKEYFCISPLVPIYKVMEGKKQGDNIDFRGTKYVITEIF